GLVPPPIGRKGSFVIRIDPQHLRNFERCFGLREPVQVSCQGDQVAPALLDGEISPRARAEIDPKATDVAVIAPWIEGAPLHALTFAAREPLGYDRSTVGPRRLRNPPVCDRAICGHRRRLRRSVESSSRVSAKRGFT